MNLVLKKNPRGGFNGSRALMIIHLVLVLLLPFLFTQMGGCQGEKDTFPVNLGPETSAAELSQALSEPLAGTEPSSIKLGEAFVISETQELGAGAAFAVLSDTSQTVVERSENADEILLTVVEHKQKYVNGQVQKTSTEIPYRIEKSQPATAAPTSPAPLIKSDVDAILKTRSLRDFTQALQLNAAKLPAAQGGVGTLESKVTYHGLRVVVNEEPPPALVQKQENCLGIPNCKITVHHVSFDMVFWENGKPDRVHWDIAMSPSVPYLAGMMNKCVTGLAKLSGDQGDILVKQCLPVLNFRYGQ